MKTKYSGYEWFGNIPFHWEMLPIKAIYNERREKNTDAKVTQVLSLLKDVGIIPYEEKGDIGNKMTDSPENHKIVYPGDLVVNKMNAIIGSLGISRYTGTVSQIYFVLSLKNTNCENRYLEYIFKDRGLQNSFRRISTGIMELRESINWIDFKNIRLPIPPLEKQKQIVTHLDEQIEKIERFINKKNEFIELLIEQRQTLINTSIIRGINKDTKLKESGVELLGKIPNHWKVVRLKYLFDEISNKSEDGIGVLLMASQIHGLVPRAKYHEKAEAAQTTIGHKICIEKDLVFNKLKAHLGVFFESNYNGLVSPDYAVYRPKDGVSSKYFELMFRHPAYIKQFIIKSTGIVEGLIRLYTTELFSIAVPLPPIEEVTEILSHIKTETATIDTAIAKAEREIELIKEYKEAMISEAVMGKRNLN